MSLEVSSVDKTDELYDVGRSLLERRQLHGATVGNIFDTCSFDIWRKRVNDLLYEIGGCEDPHYQRFSSDAIKANVIDLEEGLRIIAAVRDELAIETPK
ncbi:MAG: hypothetical protein ACP5VS_17995 [Desulfomonilaceae bacterium]